MFILALLAPDLEEHRYVGPIGPICGVLLAADDLTRHSVKGLLSSGPIMMHAPGRRDVIYGLSLHPGYPDGSQIVLHRWNARTMIGSIEHTGTSLALYLWVQALSTRLGWHLAPPELVGDSQDVVWDRLLTALRAKHKRQSDAGLDYSAQAVEEWVTTHRMRDITEPPPSSQ